MAEFEHSPPLSSVIRRRMRRFGVGGMIIVIALAFVLSGPRAERLGDRFQVLLPITALGCAFAEGRALRLVGRYLLLETFIKGPKYLLGEHPINIRPNGGTKGFPSGHTAVATFGATALVQSCLRDSPAAQAMAIMAAAFTGTSRVSSDHHNIWQVLAGGILGFLVQFLALRRFDRFVRRVAASVRGLVART